MIYCCIYIDYLPQLEKTKAKDIALVLGSISVAANNVGASISTKKSSIIVQFSKMELFSKLQIAETLHTIISIIEANKKQLRGVFVYIHDAYSQYEATKQFEYNRFFVATSSKSYYSSPYYYAVSDEASSFLHAYIKTNKGLWVEPFYHNIINDADAKVLFDNYSLQKLLYKVLSHIRQNRHRLINIEATNHPYNIQSLSSCESTDNKSLFLILGKATRLLPFSPLIEAVSELKNKFAIEIQGFDLVAFNLVARMYSASNFNMPTSLKNACASHINAVLDIIGKYGIVLLCDEPHLFSAESIELIADRLRNNRGTERYITISDSVFMDNWNGQWAAKISINDADMSKTEPTLKKALGKVDEPIRSLLKCHYEAILHGKMMDSKNMESLIKIFPPELSMYVYGLIISQPYIYSSEISNFFAVLGLSSSIAKNLLILLSRLGIVDTSAGVTCLKNITPDVFIKALDENTINLIEKKFSHYLVSRYASSHIYPSLAFLKKVGEANATEKLLYDCLLDNTLRYDYTANEDTSFLSESSSYVYNFFLALMQKNKQESEAAISQLNNCEKSTSSNAIKSLALAEFYYALKQPDEAIKAARESMLNMGYNSPHKLVARAQRLMGLASLAKDKQAEALDYLTNAQSIAENAGDTYERMMAGYAKANVEFLQGALGKALKTIKTTEEFAIKIFRMDMVAILEALTGRINMALGLYAEATENFDRVIDLAQAYNIEGAKTRAAIWKGRALIYTRKFAEATPLLSVDDYEAKIFMAELEIMRGSMADAISLLSKTTPAPVEYFAPPDAFDWSSLFIEFEGRCIYFYNPQINLKNLQAALFLFANGLLHKDPQYAMELHAMTRAEDVSKNDPNMGLYNFFCYLVEEFMLDPPVDKQTVLSRAFKIMQQQAGRIEDRALRALFMDKNIWNKKLIDAAHEHKFI